MKRREFIKKSALATAGVFAAPYILPSGRLFAATGMRKVNHVVFCLYAGGVRNLESVHMNDGNLMRNMFNGSANISPDIAGGMEALPPPLTTALQNYGTLFKEFRYANGPTGHYNGHTVALTGNYVDVDLNIREHPAKPTIFEYYRKHNSPQQSAMNSWWIANTLGPYPALNYSNAAGYGASYGANFIAPTSLISPQGFDVLGNPRNFSSNEQAAAMNMRGFVNGMFNHSYADGSAGVVNTEADSALLQQFISTLYANAQNPTWLNSWGAGPSVMNNDMYNVLFAEEVIRTFKPELLVVNMQDVDVCHFNFTSYANNLRKADFAVAKLWNTIQSTPGMMNDTVLIIAPEHGRNFQTNTSVDAFGRSALDHTAPNDPNFNGDPNLKMAREIFCMVLGPPSVVVQGQVINNVRGESTEIVPAIADLLGFETAISGRFGMKPWSSCDLQAAFI